MRKHFSVRWIWLGLACTLITGCRRHPAIVFTEIPIASVGGSNTHGVIAGRVLAHASGDRIILYAHSGNRWWIQPYFNRPYSSVEADGTFRAEIHLGMEYAAVLVHSGYAPKAVNAMLPSPGQGVAAVAVVTGSNFTFQPEPPPTKSIQFSGYQWDIRSGQGAYGGSDHNYSPGNVWVDSAGAMHLRVNRIGDQWSCAEAHTRRTLGYGTYEIRVKDAVRMEPAAMFSMFTWTDETKEHTHREMDFHVSRWGDKDNENAEYVIQPYYLPANVYRFELPAGVVETSLRWNEESASLTTTSRRGRGKAIDQWTFTQGIPKSEDEKAYVNFCEFSYSRLPLQHQAEVVIEHFRFLP